MPEIPVLFWVGIATFVLGILMLFAWFMREWVKKPKIAAESGIIEFVKALLAKLDQGPVIALVVALLGLVAAVIGWDPTAFKEIFTPTQSTTPEPSASGAPHPSAS